MASVGEPASLGVTMVADEVTRLAAVVNPDRDMASLVDYLQTRNLQLRYIFAHREDHIANDELAYRVGAKVYIVQSRAAAAASIHTLLKPGDVIEFGDVRFRVNQTSVDSLSLVLYDLAVSDRVPQAQWIEPPGAQPPDPGHSVNH